MKMKYVFSVLKRALKKLHNKSGRYHDIDIDSIKQKIIEILDKKTISIFMI